MEYDLKPAVVEKIGGALVRLSDDVRSCVVYIGAPISGDPDGIDIWGSGFFVATVNPRTIYLVTARHVIQEKIDGPFAVRINTRDGGSRVQYMETGDWKFHPTDESVDIAILEWDISHEQFRNDVAFLIHPKMIMSEAKFSSKKIGPGDLVYTVGLWNKFPGSRRNIPFVHVGHIGMVPEDEKIPVWDWMPGRAERHVEVEAYLTEGQPISGASGSPVFVRRSLDLGKGAFKADPNAESWNYGSMWLLGILSDSFVKRGVKVKDFGDKDFPLGVNIVVPSMKLNEVVDQPELKKSRLEKATNAKRGDMPVKRAVSPTNTEAVGGKEAFNSLLGAAARKQKTGD